MRVKVKGAAPQSLHDTVHTAYMTMLHVDIPLKLGSNTQHLKCCCCTKHCTAAATSPCTFRRP